MEPSQSTKKSGTYDTVIIGAGAAGMTAAIYAARYRMRTKVFGREVGGLLNEAHKVENYPGYSSISGFELMMRFKEHLDHFRVPVSDENVTGAKKDGDLFVITTDKGSYRTRTVIIATGTIRRKLGVPGERELKGKGVHYCATCDAPFYGGKTAAVVGGSDSAAQAALLLSEYADKVYMIYRKARLRAEPITVKHIQDNPKIEVIYTTNVTAIKGASKVEKVVLDTPYKGSYDLPLDGLFIEIGADPANTVAQDLGLAMNEKGEIRIDREAKTSVKGVFAAGDITDTDYKQAVVGAGEGALAAWSAYYCLQDMLNP
ncbi:FAD-dependent oxidoreductase [Candidatus Woesearchaeota archaeon]|nr:FAD-dependent oxidoreductase [Candidatus Woesearchaeota archaeon]